MYDVYSILKRTHLHQNITFTMEKESNGKLAFLDTSLKWNSEKMSILVCRKPSILNNTYATALTTKQGERKILFLPRSTEHIPL